MKSTRIAWAWFIPELALCADAHVRGKALRRAAWTAYTRWYNLCATGVALLLIVRLKLIASAYVGLPPLVFAGLVGLASGLALYLPFLLSRSFVRREVRRELNRQGVAVCVECGYQLRGVNSLRCPECGGARTAKAQETVR